MRKRLKAIGVYVEAWLLGLVILVSFISVAAIFVR